MAYRGYLAFLFIGMFIFNFAQTGIGTTTPDASAKLEVASSNKGFLPPRVALSAINSASPISAPANGLMVFNTASAGANPYQVVPGYYYWDSTGQKWVSLSTTVGNVQNQALFRSISNTLANVAITSWNSRFNNIATGDLTVTSNTTFALSNGIYKMEWSLPFQQSNTYNVLQLQEYTSGAWNIFLNDGGYANISNGGGTDWGGGTFAADVVDCTSATRTFRLINPDAAGRVLYYGATFIITKLNPSITTSTTADNLGNHTATQNIQLNGNYLSNNGTNNGIYVASTGKVGIGNNAPNANLDIRTSPTNTSDPGVGFLGVGTTTSSASSAGAGAIRYNPSNSMIEYSNGTSWQSLAPGNPPVYAQFRGNAYQEVRYTGDKLNFPNVFINVGNFSISNNNTITLPAGRIYRIDLNLGWAYMSGNWCRFAIYKSDGTAISTTAHLENGTTLYNAGGTTTTFVNTNSGSVSIDVRYVTPNNAITALGDTGNGTNFPSITIQSVD